MKKYESKRRSPINANVTWATCECFSSTQLMWLHADWNWDRTRERQKKNWRKKNCWFILNYNIFFFVSFRFFRPNKNEFEEPFHLRSSCNCETYFANTRKEAFVYIFASNISDAFVCRKGYSGTNFVFFFFLWFLFYFGQKINCWFAVMFERQNYLFLLINRAIINWNEKKN